MNQQFTEEVQAWLETPSEQRDYSQGALYFLQLSNNKIMYRNMTLNLPKYREVIEYQIRKYMKFRLAQLTHKQVEQMQSEVDRIVAAHFAFDNKSVIDNNQGDTSEQSTEESLTPTPSNGAGEFRSGKREDHDSLPPEIQACYVENLSLLQQMRELHMQLRHLSTENSTCPDSERYPFLKELIAKDKQYHKNWEIYDTYVIPEGGTPAETTEAAIIEDARAKSRDAQRQINLLKGKYKKNPSDELKNQILSLYPLLLNPTDKLKDELTELGILEATAE